MTYTKEAICCVVLAGGKASRMGGEDKGLMQFQGRPLIEHVIERIAPQVGKILINANRNVASYKTYGYPVISDFYDGYQGPLAGMEAAMRHASAPLLLTVPCDSPLLPDDLVERLYADMQKASAELTVVDTGKLQPVFCLMQTRLHDSLKAFIDEGGRKIDRWHEKIKVARANFENTPESFVNVNSPEQIKEIEQSLSPRQQKKTPKILGFCAYSGTGKTSLLIRLIPILKSRGIRVGVIKHAHHSFDTDRPGKDSYELRKAGAEQTLVSSSRRWALITELAENEAELDVSGSIAQLDDTLDLILVEGFKHEQFPKIELHRTALNKPLIYPRDSSVIAFAGDGEPPPNLTITAIDLNDIEAIAEFVIQYSKG